MGLIVGIITGVIGAIGGAIGGDAGSVISAIGFLLGAVAGFYLTGFIAMAASDKRQRLGDRLAGTVVVRETPNDTGRPEATTEDRATMP